MPVFLKYGDIKGEATEPAHRTYIELTSASLGRGAVTHSSERPHESPNISEIVVTKATDSASTHLFSESVSGRPVTAIIDFVRNDGSVSLRLEMSGALISSYNHSGRGGDNPTESLTLNFTKIEFKNDPGTPPP